MTNKEQEKIDQFMALITVALRHNWNPDIQGDHPKGKGEKRPLWEMDDKLVWKTIEDKLYELRVSRLSKLLLLELSEKLLRSSKVIKTGYRENLS